MGFWDRMIRKKNDQHTATPTTACGDGTYSPLTDCINTKTSNNSRGQTLQRGLKYTPLRKFVPSLMSYLINSLIV